LLYLEEDIDFERNLIHIKRAKVGKDRVTILPEKMRETLKNLIFAGNKKRYVFESERGGKLSVRTA